jgi:ABC-2 type transport system permease protein
MIRDLLLLIGLQLQLSWNRFWRMLLWRKLLTIFLFGLMGAGMIGVSVLVGIGSGTLLSRFPQYQLESLLPGIILTAIALFLLISSFGLALGSLFFSRDLDILMTAPVSRRAVFVSKLLGGFTTYYAIVLASALPALIAYGIGLHYGPLYFILMLIAVLGTPLLPAGLGALLVLLVARVVPARRVREVMGLAAALFGSACALLGNTASYWSRQLSATGVSTSLESLLNAIRTVQNLPVPSLMAGRGLAEAGQGNLLPALGLLSGFLLVTFGFFAGCVYVADHLYAAGWLRMQSGGDAKRKAATAATERAAQRDLLVRAAPFFAISLKDWRIIPRDLRSFAQFLSPLFLIPLIYFQLFVNTGGTRYNSQTVSQMIGGLANGVDLSSILLTGTILLSTIFVFSRIAQTGISMEGRSYWILKAAPLAPRDLLLGKFVAAMLPFTILATLLLVIAAFVRGFSLGGFLYGWFGILLLGSGMIAMDVGLSVPWANLDWDDPRKMHSGWAGLIALIGYVLIGVIGGGFLALPYVVQLIPFVNVYLTPVAWLVGPFLAVGFTGAVASLFIWLGLSRLGKVGDA